MAIDPEIRQAIEELRVLVMEAYRASGAIDRAASSGARTGERTSVDPGMARAGVASGTPAGAVPGYMAASAMAVTHAGRMLLQAKSFKGGETTTSIIPTARTTAAIFPSFLPSARTPSPTISAAGISSGSAATFDSGALDTWVATNASAFSIPGGAKQAAVLSSRANADVIFSRGGIRTSTAKPTLLSNMHARAVTVAGSLANNKIALAITAGIIANAAVSYAEAVFQADVQERETTKDIDELVRQRQLDSVGEKNKREMNRLTARVARDNAFRENAGSAVNFVATQYIAGVALRTGIGAAFRATPTTLLAYIAVKGVFRAIDYFGGADAARVEQKVNHIRDSFKQDHEYQMSRETSQRSLMRFTEQHVQNQGSFLHSWEKTLTLFGLIGDSEEEFQKEGMRLQEAEYKRQNPKIAEAKASLKFGDVYIAQRKFDAAADALHLKNDVPFMWRNPQQWFASFESSRIASRNWASSQMSRAKIRTGD